MIDVPRLEALRAEFNAQVDAMLAQATAPVRVTSDSKLVGIAEILEMTDVPYSTLASWRRRGRLPAPLAELKAGPVWLKKDIEKWQKSRA